MILHLLAPGVGMGGGTASTPVVIAYPTLYVPGAFTYTLGVPGSFTYTLQVSGAFTYTLQVPGDMP